MECQLLFPMMKSHSDLFNVDCMKPFEAERALASNMGLLLHLKAFKAYIALFISKLRATSRVSQPVAILGSPRSETQRHSKRGSKEFFRIKFVCPHTRMLREVLKSNVCEQTRVHLFFTLSI